MVSGGQVSLPNKHMARPDLGAAQKGQAERPPSLLSHLQWGLEVVAADWGLKALPVVPLQSRAGAW